jgi:hypothetical protein
VRHRDNRRCQTDPDSASVPGPPLVPEPGHRQPNQTRPPTPGSTSVTPPPDTQSRSGSRRPRADDRSQGKLDVPTRPRISPRRGRPPAVSTQVRTPDTPTLCLVNNRASPEPVGPASLDAAPDPGSHRNQPVSSSTIPSRSTFKRPLSTTTVRAHPVRHSQE